MLTVCTGSGLYEWLRLPFGPAPAPAELQSYVAETFGTLRDSEGLPFCVPLMDDLYVCSATLAKHVEHMRLLCQRASERGFEFKCTKGQYNQSEVEVWGSICSGSGRRASHRKIDQLEKWPIPDSKEAVVSFFAVLQLFVRVHEP